MATASTVPVAGESRIRHGSVSGALALRSMEAVPAPAAAGEGIVNALQIA